MRKKSPVTDIVRKTTITAQSTDRLSRVYQLMKNHALAHVTIMEQSEIVGIISRKTIQQLAFGYEFNEGDGIEMGIFDMLQAGQVMERGTPHIPLSATVEDVAELMAVSAFAALPTVHEGKPVGFVDINDLVLFLLNTR